MKRFFALFQTKLVIVFLFGLIISFVFICFKDYLCHRNYLFINENLACSSNNKISKAMYSRVDNDISRFIENEIEIGHINRASVFFRDLEGGPIFGINEEEKFTPASLLKLPLSFVVFNLLEDEPQLENVKILFDGKQFVPEQIFQSSNKLDLNQPYYINELLMRMLKYSDNDAYMLLRMFLDENGFTEKIKQTYLELGFIEPQDIFEQSFNTREYSSFFRLLYNVSYLNNDNSEKILKWLSESDFDYGLRANIPTDVKIAHKFGQRHLSNNKKYLHDCGIIYYPENPYLLCVMTEGEQIEEMIVTINYVSDKIYQEFVLRDSR